MFRKFIFPAYTRITQNRYSTRQSSERGQLVLAAALICGALGIDTDLTLNYQLFALLLVLLFSARITVRFHKPAILVKRILPRHVSANQKFSYDIVITNIGSRVEADLRIIDEPMVIAPSFRELQSSREPLEETRNFYDRFIGFHRFVWLQRIKTGIRINSAQAEEIPVKGKAKVRIEAEPLRRGFTKFGTTAILYPDLLGMNYGVKRFVNPEQLLILPKRYRINEAFELPGGSSAIPGGTSANWSSGTSDEFVSLRDYREGDSAKKIHWPSSVKRQQPVVREYQDEYFLKQSLILDVHTDNPTLLEEAVSVATSFLLRMTEKNANVELVYCAEKTISVPGNSGHTSSSSRQDQQLKALATLQSSTQPFSLLAEFVRSRTRGLTGCVIVCCKWTEEHRQLQKLIESKGVPTTALVIVLPKNSRQPDSNQQIVTESLKSPHCHYLESDTIAETLLSL